MNDLPARLRASAEQVSHALIWHTLAPLLLEAADYIDALEAADFPDVDPVTGDEAETKELP